MGTRSTIKFIDKYNNEEYPLVNIYQQFDGYIEGVGYALAEWLCKKTLVNGIPMNANKNMANGSGCLAAQFIRDFKEEPGGLYIIPMDAGKEDYNYEVIIDEGYIPCAIKDSEDAVKIKVTNFEDRKPIFEGTPKELLDFREPVDG